MDVKMGWRVSGNEEGGTVCLKKEFEVWLGS